MITPTTSANEIENVLNGFDGAGKGIKSQSGVIIRRSVEGGNALYIIDRQGKRKIQVADAVETIKKSKLHWTRYQEPIKVKPVQKSFSQPRTPHCCGEPMTQTVQGWVCDECDSVR